MHEKNLLIARISGRSGWADRTMDGPRSDMKALLDTIVEHVPPPEADASKPFSMSAVILGSGVHAKRALHKDLM